MVEQVGKLGISSCGTTRRGVIRATAVLGLGVAGLGGKIAPALANDPGKLIKIARFGGGVGEEFTRREVKEIGLRGQDWVECVYLNGDTFGNPGGGHYAGGFILKDGEFINNISGYAHDWIDHLTISTNLGNHIDCGAGEPGHGDRFQLSNIKVLKFGGSIGGSHGVKVLWIEIEYIPDYT